MGLVTVTQVFSVSSQQHRETSILLTLWNTLQVPALPHNIQGIGEGDRTQEAAKIRNWLPAGENS